MEISISQLQKQYGDTTVLDIDRLNISKGELVGIVGNNGAGKTTLFRLLLDLTEPSAGTVMAEQQPVAGSLHWKESTGSFLDEGFLIDFMSPEEYFYFSGSLYGLSQEEVDQRLLRFERFLSGEILGQNKYIRQFSTGNKQKVGIVAAMLPRPSLLILDEPFNFLDPSSQILIRQMLKQENQDQQTTMLISSHNLNHITGICDRIILLEKGRILKDLTPGDQDFSQIEEYFSSRLDSSGQ